MNDPSWLEIFSESCEELLLYTILLRAAVLYLDEPSVSLSPSLRQNALLHLLDYLDQQVHELCRLNKELGPDPR